MQTSTQTDNHNYRKHVATYKNYIMRKLGLKFKTLTSTFYAKQQSETSNSG